MQFQAEKGIDILEEIGVIVLTEKGYLHRKLAIIDKQILWEGSLNILSQKNSRELMRREKNKFLVIQILHLQKTKPNLALTINKLFCNIGE